jgi:hypothetical protein
MTRYRQVNRAGRHSVKSYLMALHFKRTRSLVDYPELVLYNLAQYLDKHNIKVENIEKCVQLSISYNDLYLFRSATQLLMNHIRDTRCYKDGIVGLKRSEID